MLLSSIFLTHFVSFFGSVPSSLFCRLSSGLRADIDHRVKSSLLEALRRAWHHSTRVILMPRGRSDKILPFQNSADTVGHSLFMRHEAKTRNVKGHFYAQYMYHYQYRLRVRASVCRDAVGVRICVRVSIYFGRQVRDGRARACECGDGLRRSRHLQIKSWGRT